MSNSTDTTRKPAVPVDVIYGILVFVGAYGFMALVCVMLDKYQICRCRNRAEREADAAAAKAAEAERLKLEKYDCNGACYYSAPEVDEKFNPIPIADVSPAHRNVLQMSLGEWGDDQLPAHVYRGIQQEGFPRPLSEIVADYAAPFAGPFFQKGTLPNSIRVVYCLRSLPVGWRIEYRLNGGYSFSVFASRNSPRSYSYITELAGEAQGHVYKTKNGLFVAYPGGAEEFRNVDHFCVQFVDEPPASKAAIEVVSE